MYEKPQYLTNEGFRRSAKNPAKNAARAKKAAVAAAEEKARALLVRKKSAPAGGRAISKEAAQLIAAAIRDMLRQK